MKVALTGASGFIGSVISRKLAEAGHEVTALVRETSRRDHIERFISKFVVGGQADQSAWPALLESADCVIHNSVDWDAVREASREGGSLDGHLRSNLCGSLEFLAASAPRQFIFMSTIAVHHDMRPRWEGKPDEDHPLRPGGLYGAYKAAVEAHLWADHYSTGRNTSAMRPCGVYGLDPNRERSYAISLIRKLKRGADKFDRAGGGKFVHVEDVAQAVVSAVGNDKVAGRPFNLVDCYARWADWTAIAADLLGREVEIDLSSPAVPQNVFEKTEAKSLVADAPAFLERGHEGLSDYLAELIECERETDDASV